MLSDTQCSCCRREPQRDCVETPELPAQEAQVWTFDELLVLTERER